MKNEEVENILAEFKYTPEKITAEIEELVWKYDISYWEATVQFMQNENIEPEYFKEMITPGLWERIRNDVEELHLIEKQDRLF